MQHVIAQKSAGFKVANADYAGQGGKWVARLLAAMTVARERRSLLQLDDRMLKDIGIGRSEAYCEASKPFGDIPARHTHR